MAERIRAAPTPPPSRPSRGDHDPLAVYAAPVDHAIFDGPADAKVTIVWAYDYACRWCEKSRATMADLRRKYGPDLRIAYTQMVVHPKANASAHAACAAAKQGGFAKLDELLWEKSYKGARYDDAGCWNDPKGCAVMTELAHLAGLDAARLKRDMASCAVDILAQAREMRELGVSGTPAFFVNGRHIGGHKPTDQFERLVDEELAKANTRIAAGTPKADYYKRHVLESGVARFDPYGIKDPFRP
jgi:protein-disulfide isomerase